MYFLDDDSFAANFGDEIMTMRTLTSLGALRGTQMCRCGREMSRILTSKKKKFRCNRSGCKSEVSLRVGSVFHDSRKQCRQLMRIGRCWLKRESRDEAVKSTLFDPETITTWYKRFAMMVFTA